MRSDTDSALDRQIVQALQIDARVPFSRIGEVVGVSGQTVARRYARLRATGALRVTAQLAPLLDGQIPWFMRIRCAPGSAGTVAEALARRADTSWVYLTSGGTEIFCGVRARADRDGGADLLARLPRTPRVIAVEAHRILHLFYGGPLSWLGKTSALSPDQVSRLEPPVVSGSAHQAPTEADRRMLAVLGMDARAPIADLAAATGLAAATVRRRLAELRSCGTLYFDVDFDDRLFDIGLRTIMWLTVSPAHLERVGAELAGHPQTAFVAATTGAAALCASLACADSASLYDYLTRRVAPLDGIHHVETAPVLRAVKYAGPMIG
ncbi:Lrp/AsnC family transcriptional regulator [Nonomuraea sediminis]|uniref:Lrp/AsnC family transcriptional regulator n=1 Tax=Nonomuraea sediminis TaxID=2835864 RepID=UPI001BDCEA48|nr:Lrp/AsnC family transcriptional regulator [Nonomuraea sediminis]